MLFREEFKSRYGPLITAGFELLQTAKYLEAVSRSQIL